MKKVLVIAKPDHSLTFINDSQFFEENGISLSGYCLNATNRNGLLSKLSRKVTILNDNIKGSFTLTILGHINRFLIRKGIDSGKIFYAACDLYFSRVNYRDVVLVHRWPMFCYGSWLRKLELKVISDCYELNPIYLKNIYADEYNRYGLKFHSSNLFRHEHNYNTLIDSDYIIAPSKIVVDSYRGIIDPEKFVVNSYGTMGMSYNPKPIKENIIKNFVFLGRVCLEKGIGKILEAARLLSTNDISFTIIGPIDEACYKLIEDFDDVKNVKFIGPVSKRDVLSNLKDADFFILPSLSDAYGMAVIEALSLGIPCIVSSRTGCCDDIVTYGMGKVFDVEDNDEFYQCILEFSNLSLADYSQYREGINKFFIAEKSSNYKNRTLSIYKEVIKNEK
ncbi:glycosyltransferase [Grimontia sp. S25]|uniref:Glycosyltransferase n=1 Tax=Grimontia sedimenti TaxID=2711294 RepID=A0A6M1RIG9_9GAMM|nr:glycosyltransferase [Grimontia sedimenti]NGO00121.1 glycosyltransferase [Grimontia sedimenti]